MFQEVMTNLRGVLGGQWRSLTVVF